MTHREPPADRPRPKRPLLRGAAAAGLALALVGPVPAAATSTASPATTSPPTSSPTSSPGQEETGGASPSPSTTSPSTTSPSTTGPSTRNEDLVDLDILSINDFHGRLEADGDVAGASRLACTVDARRAENPNTLFVSAGDNVGASTFTSFIQDDQPTIDALNAMDLDVSALGNHEFDGGSEDVDDRLVPASDFPLLGANVLDSSTGEPLYQPYAIEEVDGVDVGFIGVITEDMPNLVSPAGVEGIRWADMSETVTRYAEQLTSQQQADVIVVLAHAGAAGTDLASADGTPYGELVRNAPASVDALISGHTHQKYALQNADGTWVTQTGQYSEGLGSLELTYDRASGEVVESQAQVLDLVDEENPSAGACTDPQVRGIVDDAAAYAEEAGAEVVGDVAGELPLDRAQNSDGSENRAASSPLGSLVADAQVWAARRTTPDVDFGVMNPGGLRADLGSGEITYEELATSQPFANTLAVVDLTGEQVRRLLEQQWREEESIKLAQSAELHYTYDPTAPIGERLGDVRVDGEPFAADSTYQVVANGFLASGGDGFSVFAEAPSSDTGMTDLTGIVDYVEEHTPITPDSFLRSTAVTWLSDPEAVHGPGDEISLEVGGLAHSTESAPVGDEISVSLGGADLGTVPLDTSFVDAADQRGRASITVEVPEQLDAGEGAAAGGVPLVLEEPVTGTRLELPVALSDEVLGVGVEHAGDQADEEPGGEASQTPSEGPSREPSHEPGSAPDADADPSPAEDPGQDAGQAPGTQGAEAPSSSATSAGSGEESGQGANAASSPNDSETSSDAEVETAPSTSGPDVADPEGPEDAETAPADATDDSAEDGLASTGASSVALLIVAVVVLGGGMALVMTSRRRAAR